MVFIGHMDPFDESAKQWATYIERFEQFVSANYTSEEKQVAVLLCNGLIYIQTAGEFKCPGEARCESIQMAF